MSETGGRALLPFEFGFGYEALPAMISVWEFVHWPMGLAILPELIQYMPSHGGGWKSSIAESVYVLSCAIQLALFVMLLIVSVRTVVKKAAGMRSN
jgi:hypothetical protein